MGREIKSLGQLVSEQLCTVIMVQLFDWRRLSIVLLVSIVLHRRQVFFVVQNLVFFAVGGNILLCSWWVVIYSVVDVNTRDIFVKVRKQINIFKRLTIFMQIQLYSCCGIYMLGVGYPTFLYMFFKAEIQESLVILKQ